jgi:hypothetical protein
VDPLASVDLSGTRAASRSDISWNYAIESVNLGTDPSGLLVLGSNLQEQFCNPAAEEWLRQIGNLDTRKEGKFPTAVLAAISHLNADLGSSSRALNVWTPAGNLRIEAARSDRDG